MVWPPSLQRPARKRTVGANGRQNHDLLLVRHGRSRAGTANYDQLSARGELQSRRLGQWLAATGHGFDAVVVGTMRRHRQTYDAIAGAYAERGLPLPGPVFDSGWDEFDHHAVFDGFASAHPQHPTVLASQQGGLQALGAMIHAALSAWSEDRLADVPESWQAFGARVNDAGSRRRGPSECAGPHRGVISRPAVSVGRIGRSAGDLNLSLHSGSCDPRTALRAGAWQLECFAASAIVASCGLTIETSLVVGAASAAILR
jgi:broad specificity phosphatase PhoE